MSRYIITVDFRLKPGGRNDFMPLMLANARASLEKEAGCEVFDVLTDQSDPQRICLYEVYRDAAAFKAHLDSAHFGIFDRESAPYVERKTVREFTLEYPLRR